MDKEGSERQVAHGDFHLEENHLLEECKENERASSESNVSITPETDVMAQLEEAIRLAQAHALEKSEQVTALRSNDTLMRDSQLEQALEDKQQADLSLGNLLLERDVQRQAFLSANPEEATQDSQAHATELQKAIHEAGSTSDTQELSKAFSKLTSLYRKSTSSVSRLPRQEAGRKLVDAGVPIPSLDVFITTWNVGYAPPVADDLEMLIPTQSRLYDLVVIGLQECDYELDETMSMIANEHVSRRKKERKQMEDMRQVRERWVETIGSSAQFFRSMKEHDGESEKNTSIISRQPIASFENAAKRAITSRAGAHFAAVILQHLGSEDYFLVRECELMHMRTYVFSRLEHRGRISRVEYASQATGLANVVGNKGGVAISLWFQNLRLCFICCHLAAHRKFLSERNKQAYEILSMVQRKLSTKNVSYLSDWDCVFFFGDLNYRLVSEANDANLEPQASASMAQMEDPDANNFVTSDRKLDKSDHTEKDAACVHEHIENKKWKELMDIDQLRQEKRAGRVLMDFMEASVYPFPPSFKVDRVPNHVYNKKRLPAYCDRILWHSTLSLQHKDDFVVQHELTSPALMSSSDHKPVSSRFTIKAKHKEREQGKPIRSKMSALKSLRSERRLLDSKRFKGVQIRISNLEARDLISADMMGSADPYVVAYSTDIFKPGTKGNNPEPGVVRSRIKWQTLSCKWDDVLVIRCPGYFNEPEHLRGLSLSLSVWDFDMFSRDDPMGEMVLSIDDLVDAFYSESGIVKESRKMGRKADSHHDGELAEDDDDEDQTRTMPSSNQRRRLFVETLGTSGATMRFREKQVAFSAPLVRSGKTTGFLSGIASLHLPEEHIQTPSIKFSGCWEFLARWKMAL